MQISKTIVINCAGIGSRLSFGHTKALLEIGGKPLIYHHLDAVKDFEDVRVVVGYDYQELIKTVLKRRRHVTFVFNHVYLTTGTLASLFRGSQFGNEMIISLDGDLIVNPRDLARFLSTQEEAIGYTTPYSDEPVYVNIKKTKGINYATQLTRTPSPYEWTGLTAIKLTSLKEGVKHVYPMLNESCMPMRAIKTDAREIDTPKDLVEAMKWAHEVFK